MNKEVKYLFVILFSLLMFACKSKPTYVLSEKKMIAVITDLHLLDATLNEKKVSILEHEKREKYQLSVFDEHQVQKADFDSSLIWYTKKIENIERIYDQVEKNLQKQKNILEKE